MKKEIEDLANQWYGISKVLREKCLQYLKDVLLKNNNKVTLENVDLPESITVSYDGGNHPEYATNLYSSVYGIYLSNNDMSIYLDIEDSSEYCIDFITTNELYCLCEFIDSYRKELKINI